MYKKNTKKFFGLILLIFLLENNILAVTVFAKDALIFEAEKEGKTMDIKEDYLQLSFLNTLGCFTHTENSQSIIVTPNNHCYEIDYKEQTIKNLITDENISGQFYGYGLDKVLIKTLDAIKMGGYIGKYMNNNNLVDITNYKSSSIVEVLTKESTQPYFDGSKVKDYFLYFLNNQVNGKEGVLKVNMDLHKDFYTDVREIDDPYSIFALVNKYNKLPSFYTPDLVNVEGKQDRIEMVRAYKEIKSELSKKGLKLHLISAYRSYDRQLKLYNSRSYSNVSKTTALPGTSEHQTGLCMDLLQKTNFRYMSDVKFQNTEQYSWLLDNGHKYGIILRYPSGYTHITGYIFEPWHWRYVGVEVATFMKENNIATLEEFTALQGSNRSSLPNMNEISIEDKLKEDIEVNKFNVYINSEKMNKDNLFYNGKIYLPLRTISLYFNYGITYDVLKNSIVLKKKGEETLIDEDLSEVKNIKDTTIKLNNGKIYLGNELIYTENILYKGSIYIPVFNLKEIYGMKVDCNSYSNFINLEIE